MNILWITLCILYSLGSLLFWVVMMATVKLGLDVQIDIKLLFFNCAGIMTQCRDV